MAITAQRLKEITDQFLLAVRATDNPGGIPQSTPLRYHYDVEYFKTTFLFTE